ncbi:hypothetical protein San01_32120 [Streptomyces angustmyceticus]|uniref:Uncharacterized protein n=1 Tax=Streptomyces angustmyceticus TaxID=285578 RepID=A0A5J4LK95_9ACTN|nr:hypothetical protein San01_32120 [Streptomyces angustmyceticus]
MVRGRMAGAVGAEVVVLMRILPWGVVVLVVRAAHCVCAGGRWRVVGWWKVVADGYASVR